MVARFSLSDISRAADCRPYILVIRFVPFSSLPLGEGAERSEADEGYFVFYIVCNN